MSSSYLVTNAWREILARVFEGFEVQINPSPKWLVNPATRRRLKLDYLYPDAGIAVRFVGLTAKGQRRQSDGEALEEEQRNQTRAELCRMNGIQLFLLDLVEDPVKQLDILIRLLSRASRTLAQSGQPDAAKSRWMPELSKARDRSSALRSLVGKNPEQMLANLADGWRDRETALADGSTYGVMDRPDGSHNKTSSRQKRTMITFSVGQRVYHDHFGAGAVTGLSGKGDDATISILFDGDKERTFLVDLVQDKLSLEP